MKKHLISVIVPIYKVEKYLDKCVNSIINQTYTDLEIILVDDGSPDNCSAMCDEYAKQDRRIKVIHKANGGLSDARNAGLDICKGEYIAFVDSDDWLEDNYIKIMYDQIIEDKSDMVICGYQRVDEHNKVLNVDRIATNIVRYDNSNKFELLFHNNSIARIVAWNKLYARHIFDTLRYPIGRIYEDEFVIYDVINNCNKITLLPDVLYNYLVRNDSITGTKVVTDKIIHGIDCVKYRLSRMGNGNKYINEVLAELIYAYVNIYIKAKGNKPLRKKIYKMFVQDYDMLMEVVFLKSRLKCRLFRYMPNILAGLMRLKNKNTL